MRQLELGTLSAYTAIICNRAANQPHQRQRKADCSQQAVGFLQRI